MTLTLSPEIEAVLTKVAVRQGTTPEQIVMEMVQEKFAVPRDSVNEVTEEEPMLAEALAGHIGLVDSSDQLKPTEPETAIFERPKQTLAEALAGHIGTQHSGRGNLSQNTGKAFTRLMVEKHKAGRL